jgi:hypothetical protein
LLSNFKKMCGLRGIADKNKEGAPAFALRGAERRRSVAATSAAAELLVSEARRHQPEQRLPELQKSAADAL